MPSRNRDTLKYFFSDGAMPSAEMFSDLIDSMLNMDEEGFRKTDKNGFEIANRGASDNLLSFFKQQQPDKPVWQIRFDGNNNLVISRLDNPGANNQELSDQEKYCLNFALHNEQPVVGMGISQPQDSLHIAGNVRSEGRRGSSNKELSSPTANGEWHTIAGPFTGCQVVEVVARAKNDSKKRFAVMHAIATHTISPGKKDLFNWLGLRKRIRYTQSFYDSFLHRLKLRWRPGSKRGQYYLQIRSNCDYGTDSVIDFHITNLWSEQSCEISPEPSLGVNQE